MPSDSTTLLRLRVQAELEKRGMSKFMAEQSAALITDPMADVINGFLTEAGEKKVLETPEALDLLTVGSVVRDDQSRVIERYDGGWRDGWDHPVIDPNTISYPVTVLEEY